MLTYTDIINLSLKDVYVLNALLPIAEEAKNAETLIKSTYSFGVGEEKIEIWHDSVNHEFVTRDGVWQARYLHQTYDVNCTAEEIFEYMKADFLINNSYAPEAIDGVLTAEGEKAFIYRYFSTFLRHTQELAKKQA